MTLLSAITVTPSVGAAYRLRSDDFLFKVLDDGTLSVESYTGKTGDDVDLNIPSEFCGYEVSQIGNYIVETSTIFHSITIPDTVAQIKENAFRYCSTDILIIGKNIKSGFELSDFFDLEIEKKVISHSSYFKAIDGIVYNSNKTRLLYCPRQKKIKGYKLPDSVRTIEYEAFDWCDGVSDIDFNNVNEIKEYAFYFCSGFKCVNISKKMKRIHEKAFAYSGIETLVINDSKKLKIEEGAFKHTKIKSLKVPQNAGKSAFSFCEHLKKVTIPKNVKKISDYLFFGCTSLKTVTIPPTVKKIGKYAFGYYEPIFGPSIERDKEFIIKGKKGSAAEKYAKKNGIKFKAVKL